MGASTFTSFIDQDNPTIDALVAAGLDAASAGNHEFDQGFADLTDRIIPRYAAASGTDGAQFVMAANVYVKGTETPALQEYDIQVIDGVRVGIIGTVTQDTPAVVSPAGIAGIDVGDQVTAANRVAAKLVAEDLADVIVLVSHSGPVSNGCADVAAETNEYGDIVRPASSDIDALVAGHTNARFSCMIEGPGGTPRPVVQADSYGTTLGKITLTVDRSSMEVTAATSDLVSLMVDGAPVYAADESVKALVDAAVANADERGNATVGSVTADITRGGENGSDRGIESSLGNTIADLYLWATSNEDYAGTPAQIALMNPGGLRADLAYGEDGTVTYRDVASVQPFANTLVTMELTTAQVKAILEEQWQPDGASRPKLHLGVSDGFTYEYNPEAERGSHIVSMSLNGVPLAADQTFVVVTNSFLAAGGDSFFTFADGANPTDTGQIDLAASVAYFEEHDAVAPAPLGRASIADAAPTALEVSVSTDTVNQGGSFDVSVSGLFEDEQIVATLYSDPIVVSGIPLADAAGMTSFTVQIPADFAVGAHRLSITTQGREATDVAVTVTASGSASSAGSGTGTGATGATGSTSASTASSTATRKLANTGAELPLGVLFGGALLIVAGGALAATRRRGQA